MSTPHETVAELRAALLEAHQEVLALQAELAEAKWIGEALRERTRQLGERTKELECLYQISDCLRGGKKIHQVLQRIVNTLPQGYQFPASTSAELTILGRTYRSAKFQTASTTHACKISVRGLAPGKIRVFVSQGAAIMDKIAILPEEKILLHMVATWIGEVVDRRAK